MVTLGLLGIMAGLSAAALGPIRDRMQRHDAFNQVIAAVVRARMAAMETGDCYYVELANTFDTATRVVQDHVTTDSLPANFLVIRRLRYADCTNPALATYPSADVDAQLQYVEHVEMPFVRRAGVPPKRWLAQILATRVGMGGGGPLPLVFRPSGRVRGLNPGNSVRLRIRLQGGTVQQEEKPIQVTAFGAVCVLDMSGNGGAQCE